MKKGLKILGVSTLSFLSGFGVYALLYKQKLDKIIDNLTFSVLAIENFKINATTLSGDVFLQIKNNVFEAFSFNSNEHVFVSEIRVYESSTNKFLAVSDLSNLTIDLQPNGTYTLPKIALNINLLDGAVIALTTLQSNSKSFLNRLRFEVDLKAFSHTQTIQF